MASRIKPSKPSTKEPRKKDNTHLDFIRQLGCFICGQPAEACHIRFANPKYGAHTGMQKKPHDAFTVPMCRFHHEMQHRTNEKGFWDKATRVNDPHAFALALYFVSPDVRKGREIIEAWR